MNRALLAFLLIGIFGCNQKQESSGAIYFAGEIVNPTDSYVILYKGEEPVDSALLDADNRFFMELDSLEEGLYNFYHRPEFQYVYLEKGDSLQIRLNTVSFDESLVFSGRGETLNNFLIDLYLETESEEGLIRHSFVPLEPQAFSAKLDSLKSNKISRLESLHNDFTLSENGYELALASILYKNFYYKEKYPFWHRQVIGEGVLHDLPADFYDYRSQVSYDNPNLTFLKPYYDFMLYHIGNLAFMGCQKSCDMDQAKIRNQLHFNQHQLQLIDSLVTGQDLRDNLFRTVAFEYLLKNDTEENFEIFMEDFHARSGENRHLEEINHLSESIRNLRPNVELPALLVENTEGENLSLKDIASRGKVVFYFWSGPEPRHLVNITRRVHDLSEKHPDTRFVGICLRTSRDRWKTLLGNHGLKEEDQFWTGDFQSFAHTLVVYHPFKSILTKDGRIIDGFANLNTSF
ncbi:transaldolase [Robiginitalea sp. 2V75]|uniref:Transaldolase n=1 Tax=Robiginitalea marina TaxID=2954105 RepID=A0ABT1AVR0_9FLAO|nr:transaldolase [Robiginitalea marina]MCO5723697.1 transaldolase [Robiginitalea marina]